MLGEREIWRYCGKAIDGGKHESSAANAFHFCLIA
jgi:hypothetical protein